MKMYFLVIIYIFKNINKFRLLNLRADSSPLFAFILIYLLYSQRKVKKKNLSFIVASIFFESDYVYNSHACDVYQDSTPEFMQLHANFQ